jgi:hypothetical protein
LAYAQHWGMTKVHIETDSQVLVQAISSNEHDLAKNGAIFCEIKFQALKKLFSRFLIAHGFVIRLWTLWRLGQEPSTFWPGSSPEWAQVLVANDIVEQLG